MLKVLPWSGVSVSDAFGIPSASAKMQRNTTAENVEPRKDLLIPTKGLMQTEIERLQDIITDYTKVYILSKNIETAELRKAQRDLVDEGEMIIGRDIARRTEHGQ